MATNKFDSHCRRCPRLAQFLDQVKQDHPAYFCKPVPPFGDKNARLLIVGLAPGKHGANATGRPFTGDHAGILLYATLHKFGFSNQASATQRKDGLELFNCRITNAVKCLPPENKPTTEEIHTCNAFLKAELLGLPPNSVILALGNIAHKSVLRALELKPSQHVFGHGATHAVSCGYLLDSYHCSRYNTQTKRLTGKMFDEIFTIAKKLLINR